MIVLLDVDGVLNSGKYHKKWVKDHPKQHFTYLLDPKLVNRFKKIQNMYHPHIILVSSWKNDPKAVHFLHESGIMTDELCSDNDRMSYSVNLTCKYPSQRVILIDDDTKSLPKIHNLYHIKTRWRRGLTKHHVNKIKKIMKGGF